MKSSELTKISTANNYKIDVSGTGDIKIRLNNKDIDINRVLYVPDLSANLILSVHQMTNTGNKLVFNKKGCTIYDKNEEQIIKIKPVDRVFGDFALMMQNVF